MSEKREVMVKHDCVVEVKGDPLFTVKGAIYRRPEGDGIRAVWGIPEEKSSGMMLLLWVALLEETLFQTSEEAPVRPFLLETLKRWKALLAR